MKRGATFPNPVIKWVRNNRLLSSVLAITGALIIAVIGNFLFEWVRDRVLPWMGSDSPPNYLVISIVILMGAVIGLVVGIIFSINSFSHRQNDHRSLSINELNAQKMRTYWSMMIDINSLIQKSLTIRTDNTLDTFIQEYFYLIFEYLGSDSVRGGAIFLRKPNDRDFLYYWRGSKTKVGRSEKEFYIGEYKENEKVRPPRGTAGSVFLKDSPKIINILDQKNGIADDSSYHRFSKKPTSVYDSFVAIPIHWGSKVVGVLTIESYERYTFHTDDMPLLQCITDRLGNVLYHYNKIDD